MGLRRRAGRSTSGAADPGEGGPGRVGAGIAAAEITRAARERKPLTPARAKRLIGVGTAFDFLSGRKRQAPRWIQRSGFEWLFRLLTEPRRLWRRYLIGNSQFVWLLLCALCRGELRS